MESIEKKNGVRKGEKNKKVDIVLSLKDCKNVVMIEESDELRGGMWGKWLKKKEEGLKEGILKKREILKRFVIVEMNGVRGLEEDDKFRENRIKEIKRGMNRRILLIEGIEKKIERMKEGKIEKKERLKKWFKRGRLMREFMKFLDKVEEDFWGLVEELIKSDMREEDEVVIVWKWNGVGEVKDNR